MTSRRQTRRDKQRGQNKDVNQIIGSAQSAHHDARRGLERLHAHARYGTDDALVVLGGLRTMVVSGRQVVLILRKLKRLDPFQGWLEPIEKQIDTDPLLNYFTELRNTIEKEGLPALFATVELRHGDEQVGEAYVRITEGLHGVWTSGMVIGAEDPEVASRAQTADQAWILNIHFENPPTEHLGASVTTDRVDLVGDVYLRYLWEQLIEPARQMVKAEPLQGG